MINYQVVWDKNRVKFEQKIIDLLNSGWHENKDLIVTVAYNPKIEQLVYSWTREMKKDDAQNAS